MELLPFDAVSARFHRTQLQRSWTLLSQAAPSVEDISALSRLNRNEYLDFVRRVSPKLATRIVEVEGDMDYVSPTALSAKWPETTFRDEIIALREETEHHDSPLFLRYAEVTTGSMGRPFRVKRTSHSLQREMLRLRWALHYHARHLKQPVPQTLVYLSHYPNSSQYTYVDYTDEPLRVMKYAIREPTLEEDLRSVSLNLPGNFVLCGTPSTLHLLARAGVQLSRRPLFVISSGEEYPEPLAEEASARLGSIFEHYVMREFGLVGVECVRGEGLHLFSTDLLLRERARRIWVTDLTNRYDLFVNYLTGDSGEIRAASVCSCGVCWPLLQNFEGRPFGKPMSTAAIRG